jgi:hypothetical protein
MLQIFQVQPTEKKESKTLRGGEGPTPLNTAWNSVDRENTTSPLALSTYTYKNDNNTVFFVTSQFSILFVARSCLDTEIRFVCMFFYVKKYTVNFSKLNFNFNGHIQCLYPKKLQTYPVHL